MTVNNHQNHNPEGNEQPSQIDQSSQYSEQQSQTGNQPSQQGFYQTPLEQQSQPNVEQQKSQQLEFFGEKEVNEFRQQQQNQINGTKREKKDRPKLKGFFNMLAAGVIGSALTLTVAPHADGLKNLFDSTPTAEKGEESVPVSGPVKIQPTATSTATSSIADVVERSSKAIVGIVNLQKQQNQFGMTTSENQKAGTGSGVIFKKDGDSAYIVTNNHVVEGANELEVSFYDGEKTTAKLIGTDALTDIAVLKIDAKYADTVLSFGDSEALRPGDQVLAIGNPLGLDLSRTVTQGIVSATDRNITVSTSAGDWELNVIQTDAAINPGNSGGALINTQGQVIGINSLKIADSGVEGLGFAIPSNDLVPIINEIIKNGHVKRPFIGIGLADLQDIPRMYYNDLPEKVTGGVMVTSIAPNSAAEKAGIKVQDVIVSINGTEVKNSMDLRKYLYTEGKVGEEVEIGFYRAGKLETVKLTLTSTTAQIG